MARIRLIRHGEAAAVWESGDADPGLSELGHGQAQAAAVRLAEAPPTRLVTSPLRRCRETAAPLAARLGLAPVVRSEAAEVPTPPDLPHAERGAWLRAAFNARWSEVPGGDYLSWRDGVAAFIAELEDGTAVFTHFVAINAAVSAALDDPRTLVFRPSHASVTTVEVEAGRLRLVELGAEAETRIL